MKWQQNVIPGGEDAGGAVPWALVGVVLASAAAIPALPARAADEKPDILVIFGDDIGQANIGTFTHGLMGYQTPNIDRIAR